ncbi:MAG: carbohydrate binding family 9 domain-containing protein, partial [Ignavibacteria bacterium]|nr:carbohydrate binding family 9 domain-containing protein [Ignavibacteria bacterium]
MHKRFLLFLFLYFVLNISILFSQTSEIKDSTGLIDSIVATFTPNIKPLIIIPKLNAGKIEIDGNLSEEVWSNAKLADNFTEINPRENAKPEVDTKVKIFYDDSYIYFGFTCYETDMASVRASISDRDRMYSDDWVGPFIVTYSDLKQGFELYSNPKGIQGDLLWTPDNEDSNYDMIYDSEARMYSDRWTAEFRIPFKSLRFPNTDVQNWRIHILRNRPRGARQEIYWASVSRDDPNFMGQSGYLNGIKNIKSGNNIELLPSITATQNSYLTNSSDPES